MLQLADVHAYYGKSHILQGVSLKVRDGELIAWLGRNGVGKTTLLKCILGLVPPRMGSLTFNGEALTRYPAHHIPHLGIGYVPQGRHIFPHLTVWENLRTGLVKGHTRDADFEQIFTYFPVLKARLQQRGGTLSGGEQQMLAVSRALLGRPKLIMLDEPSEGLMPSMVALVRDTIKDISTTGVSILLVEQNVKMALAIAQPHV